MNRQYKRIGIAWLLLSVFLSIQILSNVHRHEAVTGATVDCMDCAHHVHHSDHFTTSANHFGDCLLCQFLQLVYTVAVPTVLVPLVIFKQDRRFFLTNRIVQKKLSVLYTRGPPSMM